MKLTKKDKLLLMAALDCLHTKNFKINRESYKKLFSEIYLSEKEDPEKLIKKINNTIQKMDQITGLKRKIAKIVS